MNPTPITTSNLSATTAVASSIVPAAAPTSNDNTTKKKKNEGNSPDIEGNKKKKGDKYIIVYTFYTELTETQDNIYVENENQVPFR